jgi:hypothetical protein
MPGLKICNRCIYDAWLLAADHSVSEVLQDGVGKLVVLGHKKLPHERRLPSNLANDFRRLVYSMWETISLANNQRDDLPGEKGRDDIAG